MRAGWESAPLFIDIADVISTLSIERKKTGDVRVKIPALEDFCNSTVWFHPGQIECLEQQLVLPGAKYKDFCARQFAPLIGFVEAWVAEHCQRVIDLPERQRWWSSKVNQLLALGELGTEYGEYLETTVSCDIVERPGTLVKHVSESRVVADGIVSLARALTPELTTRLKSTSSLPRIQQQLISSRTEYRTFAFGENLVTVKIDKPLNIESIDLHEVLKSSAYTRVESPPKLRELCAAIHRLSGLTFFALDHLHLTPPIYVLELNPYFSWCWLPQEVLTAVALACRSWWDSQVPRWY